MTHETTIFRFGNTALMTDVEATLQLAEIAAIGLHGEERVRFDAAPVVNRFQRTVTMNSTREAGQSLSLIFGAYVRREFGDDTVTMERCTTLARGERK